MTNQLLIIFCFTFGSSAVLTYLVMIACRRLKLFDLPLDSRKVHTTPTPRLGGLAIYLSLSVGILLFISPMPKAFIGLLAAMALLAIVGAIDDLYGLGAMTKLFFHILAGLTLIAAGVGIQYIVSPFGGIFYFNQWEIPIRIRETFYHLVLPADIITLVWIIAVVNITNFLDGLDGLAAGVAGIVGTIIIFISLRPDVNQPLSAALATMLIAAAVGFLLFNFSPAKIFMGDSGSQVIGLVIAALAIIAGAKFVTLLLVFAIPIFDGLWVVARRIVNKRNPFAAGRDHLHHKLMALGLSKRNIVLIFYAASATFGSVALVSNGRLKLVSLVIILFILAVVMIIVERQLKIKGLLRTRI